MSITLVSPREIELEREVAALKAEKKHYYDLTEAIEIIERLKEERTALKKRIDVDAQSWNRFHHLMKDHGWHPGRTDDDLIDILEREINALKAELEALKSDYDKALSILMRVEAKLDARFAAKTEFGKEPTDWAAS